VDDFKTALFRQSPQIKRLRLRILIEGGNSGMQNCSLHRFAPRRNTTPIFA
jgi:hypothetical protein